MVFVDHHDARVDVSVAVGVLANPSEQLSQQAGFAIPRLRHKQDCFFERKKGQNGLHLL